MLKSMINQDKILAFHDYVWLAQYLSINTNAWSWLMCICILINLIGFLASSVNAVRKTDLTQNFFAVFDSVIESDFLIKFVTF